MTVPVPRPPAIDSRPDVPKPRTGDWLPAFGALALIWGSSFLFIKVGVRELHPVYLTLGRCAAGALTLLVIAAIRRNRLPGTIGLWARLGLLAFIGNVVPFTLFGYGEQRISSILAGIWNGTTPLTTAVVVLLFVPAERPTRQRIAGLLVGFAGMLTVLGVWHGVGSAELVGQLLCFGAAVCYGFAMPYTRSIIKAQPGMTGLSLAAGQLLAATVELLVLAPVLAGAPPSPLHLSAGVLGSVLALGALGTGIAFVLNFRVIRVAGATTSATVTYVVPVFAVVIGILALHEHLTWYEPVGAAVVLIGVALSQGLLPGLLRVRRAQRPS
jgi:drug/metabolite transporter (DMT)-like permease